MQDFMTDEQKRIALRPKLKYRIGDIVYHKSDSKKKNPMVIFDYWLTDTEFDYFIEWLDSKKMRQSGYFKENVLTL